MAPRYRAFAIIEDPGPRITIRIGGRERVGPQALEPLFAPVRYVRIYRRRRLLRQQVDQLVEALGHDMPQGTREFHDELASAMHSSLREHPANF